MTAADVAIEEFCATSAGSTPARSNLAGFYGGSIPWVKSGELRDDVLTSTEEKVTEEGVRAARLKRVPAGSILIAMYGATVGRTAMLAVDATTNQAVCHVRPDPAKADPRYVWLALRAKLPELLARRAGGAQPNISQETIRSTRIRLPAIAEQRRIADILDKADAIRRKRKQSITLTDTLLRSTFLDLFGDPITNPKRWPVKPLGALADVGGGLQVTHARAVNPIELPYLRVANVYRGRLDLHEVKSIRVTASEKQRATLIRGDVLVVEGHGNAAELGRAAVWNAEIDLCTHQNHLIRVRSLEQSVVPEYLCAFLNSDSGRAQMLERGKTTSGLNTISTSNVRSVAVLVPPLEVQTRFLRASDRSRQLAQKQEANSEVGDRLFAALVHRAFEGGL